MSADAEVEALAALPAGSVSDALDRLEVNGQCAGILPLDRGFQLAGRAWTVQYGPVGPGGRTVGDFIDRLGPGDVAVLANHGRLDATVWGELMTATAHARSLGGTVIDGVCRDIDCALELRYPIFSRGHWMRTGKDRVQLEAVQVPVSIGGVRVEPGDLLRGDSDGVVVVPAGLAGALIAAAQEIAGAETAIRAAVEAGSSLKDARAAAGYHRLQTSEGEPA